MERGVLRLEDQIVFWIGCTWLTHLRSTDSGRKQEWSNSEALNLRCNLEDLAEFERSMGAWGRGSDDANLTEERYAKLLR